MKQVNFQELNVEFAINEFKNMDFRADIGNAIHRQAVNVPMAELARKIYYSDGPVEIEDKDYETMMTIIEHSFSLIVPAAVKRSTSEVEPVKDEEDGKC
ncbi:hypothetical protein [Parabacteroides sp. AM08-6]|uniref:hypothetical protein n=1 Tax=Parabacteroides sp. AM08-6 TaxID=2292053 RepID=UPI000EFF6225|nr:hypothetical protein [Parabacteroides sp. AM08-6]RHJ77694.1 hypothetical protein DW103_15990 [Parabacteroides sp. AM08-6]